MEKLEIKIEGCKHLNFNVERNSKEDIDGGYTVWFNSLSENYQKTDKTTIGRISNISGEEVICELTNKPCVLYEERNSKVNFEYMERCPAFIPNSILYIVEGKKDKNNKHHFYASVVKRKRKQKTL